MKIMQANDMQKNTDETYLHICMCQANDIKTTRQLITIAYCCNTLAVKLMTTSYHLILQQCTKSVTLNDLEGQIGRRAYQKSAISRKRCELEQMLLLFTNRKSYTATKLRQRCPLSGSGASCIYYW